jgi:hypothetical protein
MVLYCMDKSRAGYEWRLQLALNCLSVLYIRSIEVNTLIWFGQQGKNIKISDLLSTMTTELHGIRAACFDPPEANLQQKAETLGAFEYICLHAAHLEQHMTTSSTHLSHSVYQPLEPKI